MDDGKITAFHADRNLRQGLLLFDRVLAWQTGRARRTASDPTLVGVPAEDLDLLEAMEDRIDADDARKVLADMKAKGEKPIPLAKLKKQLGL